MDGDGPDPNASTELHPQSAGAAALIPRTSERLRSTSTGVLRHGETGPETATPAINPIAGDLIHRCYPHLTVHLLVGMYDWPQRHHASSIGGQRLCGCNGPT